MVDEREVRQLLDDRPDLADALTAVLAVDEETDEWEFDDVPVGTGIFGEIVGEGLVEDTGDGYRVADSGAVQRALAGREGDASETEAADTLSTDEDRRSERSVHPTGVSGWCVAVAVVVGAAFVVARALPYRRVFRDGTVVLSGNDPYFYRYWVEGLLARSSTPVALGTLADLSAPLDGGGGEPLLVATLWWVATLLGGTADVAGVVLAWYPVAAALCTGALTYAIAASVLDDRRVGVVAVALLALTPAHAMRTSLGFADHHAFDYAWLLATVVALAWLVAADERSGPAVRRGVAALGVSVAGLSLAWEGAPLMLVPVAASVAVSVPLAVSERRSPWRETTPVVAGLGLGGTLTLGAHLVFGWQPLAVALVPALLAAGTATVAGAGELVARRGLSARTLAVAELATPIVVLLVAAVAVDGALGRLASGVAFLLGTRGIAETASAFTPDQLFGVKFFGLGLLVALPVMGWGVIRTLAGDRRWLVLSVYGWVFFALSVVQVRFVGQLAPLLALFAGVGVVWIAARYDFTPTPGPVRTDDAGHRAGADDSGEWIDRDALTRRAGLTVAVLLVVLAATAGAYLPSKVTGSAVPDRHYETATWMAGYADDRGWRYPDDYVFSRWGVNRMFNYFVNGQSRTYGYAKGHYPAFISSTDAERWYERLHDRVGFVVLSPLPRRANTMQERLYYTYGSRWEDSGYEAVSHYRAVYASANRENKVFVLVPGARVVGRAAPNATLELRMTVDIPNDSFLYRQQVRTDATGGYEAVVPYPGEYEVRTGSGNVTATATIPESAVRNGTDVRAE